MDDDLRLLRDENYDPSIKPDKWYYFEALDRCSMLMTYITDALCNHPALSDVDAKHAQDAVMSIMEIYQNMGCKLDEVDPPTQENKE